MSDQKWVTNSDDHPYINPPKQLSERMLAVRMSEIPEFICYEIGEDSEGQLIIYTGLYNEEAIREAKGA